MHSGRIVKTAKSKKGNEIVIRYLKEDDLDAMLQFANELSKEDTFVMLSGETVTRQEEEKFLDESFRKMQAGNKIHLVALVNGKFAGSSSVERGRKRKSHTGSVSISIAKPFREEGIGTIFMQSVIDEARKSGYRLLELTCFETNVRALHLYEKIGFQRAGFIPAMYAYKGDFYGEVILYLPLV